MAQFKYYPKDLDDQIKFISYLENRYNFIEHDSYKTEFHEAIYFSNDGVRDLPCYWLFYGKGNQEEAGEYNNYSLFSFNVHPHKELIEWYMSDKNNEVEALTCNEWFYVDYPSWHPDVQYRKVINEVEPRENAETIIKWAMGEIKLIGIDDCIFGGNYTEAKVELSIEEIRANEIFTELSNNSELLKLLKLKLED